ncbi:serine palmitoyltransferase small subunit family protein [Sporobolomyces salmoneus]|uniref:serine palmitoyltransferase small subunit family protein n=1 Tax=Sporobolomyces salmoneus TaxID=183962 RepID=UPI00317E0888
MPRTSPSKLYQRTKALLTPPSSPPTSTLSSQSLESSPSSSLKMPRRSNAASTTHSTTTTIVEQPGLEGEGAGGVEVPKSEWKPPRKIGTLESWLIFYEGMFAGSMLEVWEKVLLHSILIIFLTLLALAASYLPGHLRQIASHARYYAYGTGEYTGHK